MPHTFPIIDLFAGPGGLGEGFSRFQPQNSLERPFRIVTSIEKDHWAHKTLELRSFYRQFGVGRVPDAYFDYLRSNLERDELFSMYPVQASAARKEALHKELGETNAQSIASSIQNALSARPATHTVLIGGPPCQAYSVIGRARMSGNKDFENDKRHFLYREYLRIIAQIRPSVFVMENVKGMLSSKIDGSPLFDRILSDLRDPDAALFGGEEIGGLFGVRGDN